MYAGQSSGIIDSVQPAAVIAQTLAVDAQQVLNRLAAKNTRPHEAGVVQTPTHGGSTDRS